MRPHAHNLDRSSFIPFIKYHPELKRFFGCSEAVLIFEKLEYWTSRYSTGFWKFFEPCAHPLYKIGDSWQEELEISRKVFRRAFAAIGIHYKSKSAYLSQSDPFQEKMYASYYDRKTNRTYFLRNHQRVQDFLTSFWQGVKKLVSKVSAKVGSKGSYRKEPLGKSFTYANNISLQRSTSSQELVEPEFLEPQPLPPEPEREEEQDKNIKVAQDMLEIWNKITGSRHPLRSDLKVSLPQALRDSFQESLELWTNFCLSVASSKFLMGEAPNSKFKAHLAWLIKPQTIQSIREKYYSLGDREVIYVPKSPQPQAQFSRCDIQGSDRWKEICEHLSHRLGYATFRSWFRDVKFLREETTKPILQCPTRFITQWIQSRYQSDLEGIVRQLLPHAIHLEITSEV